jgi:hypothetical protein
MNGMGMGTPNSYQGGKMNWERGRHARRVWRPAEHILDRKRGARRTARRPGRSRSPDIPKLSLGAGQSAHFKIYHCYWVRLTATGLDWRSQRHAEIKKQTGRGFGSHGSFKGRIFIFFGLNRFETL